MTSGLQLPSFGAAAYLRVVLVRTEHWQDTGQFKFRDLEISVNQRPKASFRCRA